MGFVFSHMVGNLKLYLGPETIFRYAEFLRDMGEPILPRSVLLWAIRSVLILLSSCTCMQRMRSPYKTEEHVQHKTNISHHAIMLLRALHRALCVGPASLLFSFLFWHLADFTWGWVNPGFVRGDVYRNVTASLERVPVTILYVVANLALGVHLFHGAWSLFQSLGVNNPKYNKARKVFAWSFAAIIVIGNVSFPIAVQLGIIGN